MDENDHGGYFLYSTHKLLHYYTAVFKVFKQKIHLFKFSQPNIIGVENTTYFSIQRYLEMTLLLIILP